MSGPPPSNLMEWPKAELAKEVERLRAVMREHAEQIHDPSRSGGDSVGGSPYGRGDSLLDTRGAVLLDYSRGGAARLQRGDPGGLQTRRAPVDGADPRRPRQLRHRAGQADDLFGPDGAAGIVTQLFGLAGRAGGRFALEFQECMDERLREMP